MKKKEKVSIQTIILGFLGILVGVFLVVGIILYSFGSGNYIIGKMAKDFLFPAAFVGKTAIITTSQLEDQLTAVKTFYENQNFSDLGVRIDFTTPDGEKRLAIKKRNLLNKLIENKIIEKLAKERGIVVSREMASQEVERKMDEYGSRETLGESMQNLYGWTVDDFKENIVRPDLYRQKLEEFFEKNESTGKAAKEKIQKAQKALENKKSFEEVVTEFSEGESQRDNGELGWFSKDQLLEETADQIFSLEKGKTSEAIKSSLGYHIIQVEDKKNENGKDWVKIRQIFVRVGSFGDWLTDQEKNISVKIPLKEFYWDKERAVVEFSDSNLKSYAEELEKKSTGDTSIIF